MKRRSPRGSALILAVLIMLAMLGLGMMAMRTTTQAMAGSGQQRLARQARYVAEMGLYHVATLMNRGGLPYLQRRQELQNPPEPLRIRFGSDGAVEYFRGTDEAPIAPNPEANSAPTSPLLSTYNGQQNPLGAFAQGAGLVPSYRVVVDGFTALTPVGSSCPGGAAAQCPKDCLAEFTATGYIAPQPLPDGPGGVFDQANAQTQYAQQTMKAVLKFPVSDASLCR